MPIYPIRVFPDPVLRLATTPVTDFGPDLARLVEDMLETMYEAPGVGLAGPQIGSDGRLLEWEREYEEAEPGHRHVSHLYGLHPSDQISMTRTPELALAARKSLEGRHARGGGHTGCSRAWIINYYAPLQDGDARSVEAGPAEAHA